MNLKEELANLLIQEAAKLTEEKIDDYADRIRVGIMELDSCEDDTALSMSQEMLQMGFSLRMQKRRTFRRLGESASSWQCMKALSSLLTRILIETDYSGEEYFALLRGAEVASLIDKHKDDRGLNYSGLSAIFKDLGFEVILV